MPNLPTGKWEIMNPPFWISAYCKSGLEDGKNGKKMLWFTIFPPVLLETNQPRLFLHILPIYVKFSNFWFSNRKKEKTCCKQGNKSLETQYRILLAISRPPPASQQTNILLPTGLEFQHLFMFKRLNKRKHAKSRKKVFGTQYQSFFPISTPLPARRQRFHFPQSVFEIQHLQMGKREDKIGVWNLHNIGVSELFPSPHQ